MQDENERTITVDELAQIIVDRVAEQLRHAANDLYGHDLIDSRLRDLILTTAENLHS